MILYYQRRGDLLLGAPNNAPIIPRVTAPATVRATGDFRTCSNVLGGSFALRRPARAGGAAGSEGACCHGARDSAAASAGAAATLAASRSRALSRSIGCAYSLTWRDVDTRLASSSSGSGDMLDEGGISRVANGGVGTPFGERTVMNASPIPSVVSVSSTS